MSEKLRDSVVLFLLAFFLYNINLRPIAAGDSVTAALMPIVILTKGGMAMDEYIDVLQ